MFYYKKEVITVYFIHNYVWGYKPINRKHWYFWQACPLHNAKKKKQQEGKVVDQNKTEDEHKNLNEQKQRLTF